METRLPTTKHRRGRRTARQERALEHPGDALITMDQLRDPALLGSTRPLVLDIGFGSGEAVVAMATADALTAILAVDMHTPGIGDLLASIDELRLDNVFIIDADIRDVVAVLPAEGLSGVRTFFPDPWPKKRHHRRRLITAAFADELSTRVQPGGFWHIATDWSEYAEAIVEAVLGTGSWHGGPIPRPAWRPETRYERRGRAAGREVTDLWFERTAT